MSKFLEHNQIEANAALFEYELRRAVSSVLGNGLEAQEVTAALRYVAAEIEAIGEQPVEPPVDQAHEAHEVRDGRGWVPHTRGDQYRGLHGDQPQCRSESDKLGARLRQIAKETRNEPDNGAEKSRSGSVGYVHNDPPNLSPDWRGFKYDHRLDRELEPTGDQILAARRQLALEILGLTEEQVAGVVAEAQWKEWRSDHGAFPVDPDPVMVPVNPEDDCPF